MTTKASDLIPQSPQDNTPTQTQSKSQAEAPQGGSIAQAVNTTGVSIVKQSYQDGVVAGQKANDAFALGLSKARKAGAEKMVDAVATANNATAAAIQAISIDDIAEEFGEIDPFTTGSSLLLG